jgi:hypothetical protein
VAALPSPFEWLDDTLEPTSNDAEVLDHIARYLRLADIALLDAAREEQRRIKEHIKPSVERYRKLTGHNR